MLGETSTLGGASTLELLDLSHTSRLNQSAAALSRMDLFRASN
jgi:hypothetical protein